MLAYVLWHLFGWEKPNMHDALIDPEICPRCGEHLIGDGYTIPVHCPNPNPTNDLPLPGT